MDTSHFKLNGTISGSDIGLVFDLPNQDTRAAGNPRMVLKEECEQFWLRHAWAEGKIVRAITQAHQLW